MSVKLISKILVGVAIVSLSCSTVFAGTTNNFGLVDWQFTPAPGSTAPLFRSSDNLTVKVVNLRTDDVVVPSDGQFTCKIEARKFSPELAPDVATGAFAWKTVAAAGTAYTTANGCSGSLTKALRGSDLNWSFRVTVTGVSDTSKVYQMFHHYAFNFQGAGTASGG